jgi:glycosyltransferase involved in cell wall biosynthesis
LSDDQTSPVILGIGRLHPQKDFITLLKAFSILREKQELRLVILGEGAERERLVELAKSLGVGADVSFPGFVANPFSFLNKASVFVLSSQYEGMPNVLLQAMACGTPIVSTDCKSGPREVLGDNKFGTLVPVAEPALMAEAIREVLGGPRREDAAEFAGRVYGVEKSAKDYLGVVGLA